MVIEPLGGDREHRPHQVGRIRLGGHKQSRGPGRAIDTFRLTSQERRFLDPVAELYGGTVKPWHESKSPDRFEVITETREMSVILPPGALFERYEFWTGDMGLLRRCDGEWCRLSVPGPEGPEVEEVPCVCRRRALEGKEACKYKLRLNVMLPQVETIGVWGLHTGSRNAKEEIPGVVAAIEALGGASFTRAVLRLEQRTSPGRRFNVPVLDVKATVEALVAGEQRLVALPGQGRTNDAPALGPGASLPDYTEKSFEELVPDDEVIDAELVDDEPEHVDPMFGRAWLEALTNKQVAKVMPRAVVISQEMGLPVPINAAALHTNVVDRLVSEFAHALTPEPKETE